MPKPSSTAIDDLLTKLTPQLLHDVFSDVYTSYKLLDVFFPKFSFEKTVDLLKVCHWKYFKISFDYYVFNVCFDFYLVD